MALRVCQYDNNLFFSEALQLLQDATLLSQSSSHYVMFHSFFGIIALS